MARNTSFTFYHDVNLSPNNDNTYYFADRGAQASFFANKIITTVSQCYYQRADINKVQVERSYATLYKCDYLSFINPDYENKRFYGFVTGVTYINDTTTEISYIIDNLQTWLLDCAIPSCFIERQHSATDEIGESYLYDSLDCGEYKNKSMQNNITSNTMLVFVCTFNMLKWVENRSTPSYIKEAPTIMTNNGIYNDVGIYACYSEIGGSYNDTLVGQIIADIYNGVGGVTLDDFLNIYIYPSVGLALGNSYPVSGLDSTKVYEVGGAMGGQVNPGQTINLLNGPSHVQNFTLDGYTPKNNKLFQYPYCLLHVTNNNGGALDLKFEKFRDGNGDITQPQARIFGTSTSEAKLRLIPEQYLGEALNDYDCELGLDSGAFPTVAMTGDSYLIYLAQNKNRIETGYNVMRNQMTAQVVGWESASMNRAQSEGASSLGTSIVGGSQTASGIFDRIAQNMAQTEDMAIAPNTAKGLSGVGLNYQNGKKNFTQVIKTIDSEHARMIDDYYTLYGYPVKKVDVPNLHARTGYTYIRTVGCILKGNCPENAKAEIESLFDRGLRFWVDTANFGDYSITNSIIT